MKSGAPLYLLRWGKVWQQEWQRLRALDWQTLDLRDAGAWPWLLKVLSGGLVFLMALVATCAWLVSEHRASLAQAQQQEIRLLSDYRSSVHAAGLLNGARTQLAGLEEQMTRMRALLAPQAALPALRDSIRDAADENQLTIDDIYLRPVVSQVSEHPIDIQVVGDYHQLAQFVNDISRLEHLVTQHDITLAPIDQAASRLSLSFVAKAYSDADAVSQDESEEAEGEKGGGENSLNRREEDQ